MRFRIAGITTVVLTAILMVGCTAAPIPEFVHVQPQPQPQISIKEPPGPPDGGPATFSTIPVSVGDVSWIVGGGSGGSTGDSAFIDSQEYLFLLTPEQMVVYEAAGNAPGRVSEEVAQSLSPIAVIDSLRLRQEYPSASVTFTVMLAE